MNNEHQKWRIFEIIQHIFVFNQWISDKATIAIV